MNFEINPALTSWINCNFPDTYVLPWSLGCLGLPCYNHPGSFPSKKIVGSLLAMPKKSAKASKNDAVARDAVRPATSDEEILRQRRRSSTRVY